MSEKNMRILILGAGVMQGPALSIAAEMGLETVAADMDPGASCVSMADRFEKVDVKDREGIEELARSLMENGGLSGIMTAGTDFSANVAWAAEKLKLPGIPYENALDASDKERMRRRFREAGVPSPEFIIMESPPEEGCALPFSWPAVVKPVDNMGARGCRRVDDFAELKAAVIEALKFSRSGRAIVEEFMEGPEFSADALVYQGEITITGFADRHIFFPPYFIEMGHTIPSAENPEQIKSLLEAFCRGIKALGITNGAAKGDIKLTSRGPMIGEIAARLSGGYMSGWTYPYSSGVLPTRGAIEIAIGEKPGNLKPQWNHVSAERAFISIPGRVKTIIGVEKAKAIPFIKNIFMRIKPGDSVSFPENNVSKCGNVISAAENREDAVNAAQRAALSVLIRLEAPNDATSAFLSRFCEVMPNSDEKLEKTAFPPDAFTIDSRLFKLLAALPETSSGAIENITRHHSKGNLQPEYFRIIPFPEFSESSLKDYAGRSAHESLDAVRALTALELPLGNLGEKSSEYDLFLGQSFWKALIRGGYQGAVYYIDSLGNNGPCTI